VVGAHQRPSERLLAIADRQTSRRSASPDREAVDGVIFRMRTARSMHRSPTPPGQVHRDRQPRHGRHRGERLRYGSGDLHRRTGRRVYACSPRLR
jgi:hypothetical protein